MARRSSRQGILAAPIRDNGRKRSTARVAMILSTLLVALGSYSLSARVASEAKAVAELGRGNRALAREVDTLADELRVRMRLPQLERWNDAGFRMRPASASQFLKTPVELSIYALGPEPQMERAPILVSAPADPQTAPAPLPPDPLPTDPLPTPQPAGTRPPPGLLLAAASPAPAAPLAPPSLAPPSPSPSALSPPSVPLLAETGREGPP